MKKLFTIIFVALFGAMPALASDWAIGAHIASLHLPARNFNNVNPGLYVRHTPTGFTAGAYYNSVRKPSAYVGHTSQWAGFDVTVGVVTGYERKVSPLLLVSREIGNGWRVGMAPPAGREGATLLHLMKDF